MEKKFSQLSLPKSSCVTCSTLVLHHLLTHTLNLNAKVAKELTQPFKSVQDFVRDLISSLKGLNFQLWKCLSQRYLNMGQYACVLFW